ncbi:hypothetical protein HDV63DRAFT_382551 [Trichoderma sp. SZMC 28014]
MMKTIYEVDEENHHGGPDPPVPPLLYVPSQNDPTYYVRSFQHPAPVLNPHSPHINVAKCNPEPDIFYPAWRPLPGGFRLSVPVRPLGVLVKLTQDGSLVNVACPKLVRPDLPGAARKKALDSTEILEHVFSHLDEATLLTSVQRVCKGWKEVVDGSVRLQRKLFFIPDETRPLEPHPHTRREKGSDSGKVYPVLNSLLVRHFRSTFFPFGGKFYGYTRRSESFYEQRWTSKRNKLKLKSKLGMGHNKYESVRPNINKAEALQIALDRDRFTRAGASWRRMLVSQPPIPDFIAMQFSPVRINDPKSPEKLEFCIFNARHPDKGLRMGQLYDFVQDKVSNHPLDSLWYRVLWFEPRAPFASDLSEDGCGIMFDDLNTKCVVEMFHRDGRDKTFSPTSSASSLTARAGPLSFIRLRDGPLSCSGSSTSASRSRPNPPSAKAFDAIFKCVEFEPEDWTPAQEVVDYGSPRRRTLIRLED